MEWSLTIVDRSFAKSAAKIAPGKHTIIVRTMLEAPKPSAPAGVVLRGNRSEVCRTTAKMTVPAAFTATEGTHLGSTVSRDYSERRPSKLDGKIGTVKVEWK